MAQSNVRSHGSVRGVDYCACVLSHDTPATVARCADRIHCTTARKGLITLFIRFAHHKCHDLVSVIAAFAVSETIAGRTNCLGGCTRRLPDRPIGDHGQLRITGGLWQYQPRKGIGFAKNRPPSASSKFVLVYGNARK